MKKLLSKLAIVMFMSCFFMSCTSAVKTYVVSKEKDYQKAFIGASHNEIVSAFGAPDRQTSDGAGGTILIYERTTTSTTSDSQAAAYNVNYYNKTYTPGVHSNSTTTQNTSYVHLFIDKDGVCYNVRSNHQEVVREVDEEQLAKNRKKGKIWGAVGGGLFGLILSLAMIAGGA